ncbi:MAG TPA: hypothetical protein VMW31_01155 [Devosiaceae bacterium]|nr:hypothetical protein [Devosiaceae bacterium]
MKKRKDPQPTDQKKLTELESLEPEDVIAGIRSELMPETGSDRGDEVISNFEPEGPAEADSEAEPVVEETLILDDPQLDGRRFDEPRHDDHALDDVTDEPGHRTLAATALMVLVGVIVVAGLALWVAPKLAPHLPASVAQYLLPGQIDTESRLADLDNALAAGTAKTDAAIAALNAEIAALSGRLDAAADSGQTEAATAASQAAADAAASVAARIDTIEAKLAALRDEFSAVSSALADAGTGDSPASPEIAAAVAALGARLDNLATSVDADSTALAARLDAVESSAAAARDVQSEALGEASSAIRQARLQATIDVLASRLAGGLPYGEKLNELAELTGAAPPSLLSAAANTGLATAAALEASFGRHAQAAVAADVQASAGDGSGTQALGWLRAQFAGRPTTEQPGDSVGAITSRIAARVAEGNLAEALTEADTLPAHAQTGLGGWLDQLRARVAADTALADWRAQIGAGG